MISAQCSYTHQGLNKQVSLIMSSSVFVPDHVLFSYLFMQSIHLAGHGPFPPLIGKIDDDRSSTNHYLPPAKWQWKAAFNGRGEMFIFILTEIKWGSVPRGDCVWVCVCVYVCGSLISNASPGGLGRVLWNGLRAAVGRREYQKRLWEKGAAVQSLQLNLQRVSHKVASLQVNNEEDNVGLSVLMPGFPSLNNDLFLSLSLPVCVWNTTEWATDKVLRLTWPLQVAAENFLPIKFEMNHLVCLSWFVSLSYPGS